LFEKIKKGSYFEKILLKNIVVFTLFHVFPCSNYSDIFNAKGYFCERAKQVAELSIFQ